MKVFAAGALARPNSQFLPSEAMHYVLSLAGVSTVIIGCSTPAEVEANVRAACQYQPLSEDSKRNLEQRSQAREAEFTSYKKIV